MHTGMRWLALVLALVGVSSCKRPEPKAPAAPRLFTLAYPTTWLAEQVGGDSFTVVDVRPEHDDPDSFAPTGEMIYTIQEESPVVLIGGGYERWYRKEDFSSFLTFQLVEPLGPAAIEGAEPFVWLEPETLGLVATGLADHLSLTQPDAAEAVRARQQALTKRLGKLQAELHALGQGVGPVFGTRSGYAYAARALGWDFEHFAVDLGKALDAATLDQWKVRMQGHPARVLLVDAEPAEEVTAALESIGLRPVLFPPLLKLPKADRAAGKDLIEVYRESVTRVATAAGAR